MPEGRGPFPPPPFPIEDGRGSLKSAFSLLLREEKGGEGPRKSLSNSFEKRRPASGGDLS